MDAAASFNLSAIAVAAGSGAVAGAISAGITGGSVLKGALFGGISGALFAAVGAPLGRALSAADMLGNPLVGNFIAQGFVGGLNSTIESGNFGSGFLAGGVGSLAGSWSGGPFDPGHMLASAIAGGAASVLGGGKFENGAITGAFGYLFNECAHNACWASSSDLAAYKAGGPYGFWKSMCAGGDPIACTAMGSTANAPVDPLSLGTVAKAWLETAYQNAHATEWAVTPEGQMVPLNGQMTPEIEMQYSQAIADAYIHYLGTTESEGKWPSWSAINQLHWDVNRNFGMGPSAYGGTPLGTIAPNMMKDMICPNCAP